MIKNTEFTYKYKGETFTVLVEYLDTDPITLDRNNATCPSDLTGEFEILEVVVLDQDNQEVEGSFVSDETIKKEIATCKNCFEEVGLEDIALENGMTYSDLWSEGDSFYGR